MKITYFIKKKIIKQCNKKFYNLYLVFKPYFIIILKFSLSIIFVKIIPKFHIFSSFLLLSWKINCGHNCNLDITLVTSQLINECN